MFILIAFGAFVWFSYTPINEKFASADEIYYKQYMLKLEGELTPVKEQFLADEQAKFDQAEADMQRELANGSWYAAMKYQNILAQKVAFDQVKSHAEYLKNNGGEFVYDTGYKLLTGDESAGKRQQVYRRERDISVAQQFHRAAQYRHILPDRDEIQKSPYAEKQGSLHNGLQI